MRLEGIHHITRITGDAPGNVDFYTRVLGLRLVAKSVNQDNPDVYHLFFADEEGRAGADLDVLRVPGRAARAPRGGNDPPHRVARRLGRGARLLGAAVGTRAWPPNETATACASPIPRGSGTSSSCAATATSCCGPSIRRSRPSTRSAGSTRSAPTPPIPSARGHCSRTCSARPRPARRRSCAANAAEGRSPTTPHRGRASRARAPSTTWPGGRRWPSTRDGTSASRAPESG